MAQILDYSAGYPGGAAVERAGYEGVIRYLRKEGKSRVLPITAAELFDMHAHGRTVALLYQHVDLARPTQGHAAGVHDARWALDRAHEIGAEPPAIYLAVDFDAAPASVVAYFAGAGDVLGDRLGAYGGFRVLARLFDDGLITWGWQTVAWSGGRRDARAHLFQRADKVIVGGITCDVNDVLKPDYGQIGGDMAGEIADNVMQFMIERMASLPDDHPFKGKEVGDMLLDATGYASAAELRAERLEEAARRIEAALAELAALHRAAVDEAALAAELAARGFSGAALEQVKEAIHAALARAGRPERGAPV